LALTGAQLIEERQCSALVITCSDFRFKTAERAFAAAALPDDYDLIARPGAIRAFVAPKSPAMRETLEAEIELLWAVHQFPRVLMVNHISCRAYDDLATEQNQVELHSTHLRQARGVIEQRFAGVTAEPYLVQLIDGELRVVAVDA
jgi:hypothetical protein